MGQASWRTRRPTLQRQCLTVFSIDYNGAKLYNIVMIDNDERYIHGVDDEMQIITDGVKDFVLEGEGEDLSLPLLGLEVFAVIQALRENDEEFHGGGLDEEQNERLEVIETAVDEAVEHNDQYFPFGQNRNKWGIAKGDRQRLRGDTSWGKLAKRGTRSAGHGGEITSGRYRPNVTEG